MATVMRRLARLEQALLIEDTQPARREDAEAVALRAEGEDIQRFAELFLPHLCKDGWSAMHQEFFADYRQEAGQRGLRRVTAAPRGSGKTTVRLLVKVLHEICYATEQSIVVFASRAPMAVAKTKLIRAELDSNTLLREVYGLGPGLPWNYGEFVVSNGVHVLAASRHMQVRGLLPRPTKIYLDDAEHSAEVQTPAQREKFAAYVNEDILPLGETGVLNVDAIGTILCEDSWLETMLRHPVWEGRRYSAVRQFATNIPLWSQWRNLVLDLTNPHRREDAEAFYAAHEAEMVAGAEVLWPMHESYKALMLERLTIGETAFWKEKQNILLPTGRSIFAMDQAAYCTLEPQGIRWHSGRWVSWQDCGDRVAYFDPNAGTSPTHRSDWSSCPVVVQDSAGYSYCVDVYHAQLAKTSEQLAAIVAMLAHWDVRVIGVEANGFQMRLAEDLAEEIARWKLANGRGWDISVVPVVNTRNKVARIVSLEPAVANHWLLFADQLSPAALGQLRRFVPLGGNAPDDFPDALEGALRIHAGKY